MPKPEPSSIEVEAREKLDIMTWDFLEIKGNEFFSYLLSNLKIIIDPNHPFKTAYTSGTVIGYYPEFVMQCSMDELMGVTYHELQHVIYEHVPICMEMQLQPMVHNIACDHYNNLEAQAQGWVLPRFIEPYRDPKFKGWSSMEIYDYLVQDENKDELDESLKLMEIGGGGLGQDVQPMEGEGQDGQDPTEAAAAAREAVQDAIMQAVIQCDMNGCPGSVPSDARRLYEEVTAPKVNWPQIIVRRLKKYSRDNWTLRRPNRRFIHQGIYMPSLFNEQFGSLAFGFDVSGSMSAEDLGLCVAVAKNIRKMLKPEVTHVMCFDTEVHKCASYKKNRPFDKIELIGGGGTDVNPFLELCRQEKPDVIVCFTDGEFFAPPAQDDINHKDLYWVLTESPWCDELKGTQIRMDQL